MAVVDLKTNRDLLDSKFEGYKLSLDPIPVLKQSIDPEVKLFVPKAQEYTYIEVNKSSHFNHLFQDVWNPSCVFFINKDRFVCWCRLNEDGHLSAIRTVFELPIHWSVEGNASILFPDNDWSVIHNGGVVVYLVHTPSRHAGEPWTLCHIYCDPPELECSYYLLDSSYLSFLNRHQIDCLIMYFFNEQEENENKHLVNIKWVSFTSERDMEEWNVKRTRKLVGTTSLLYCSLEKSFGDTIYLASEKEYNFVYDSEKAIESKGEGPECPKLYTYLQTPFDITVILRLSEEITVSDIEVLFKPNSLSIKCRGRKVLGGILPHLIVVSCSFWVVTENRLELTLCKAEEGLMWTNLIEGDSRGEELFDRQLVRVINNRLAHLTSEIEVEPSTAPAFNMSQLEECDSCSGVVTFWRIDGNSHCETHKVHLGGHQWLFSSHLSSKMPPVLCLRHDVDGLVWQPKNVIDEGDIDHFKMEHITTFSAFGYVQASKKERKFVTCSPSLSYAAIIDWARHVYIYCKPESLNSALELRNRRTGESILHVAKQHVINLEDCHQILGVCSSDECIFVLSSNMLYAIKVHAK